MDHGGGGVKSFFRIFARVVFRDILNRFRKKDAEFLKIEEIGKSNNKKR